MFQFDGKKIVNAKIRLTNLVIVQSIIAGLSAALAFYESAVYLNSSCKLLLVGFGAMFLFMTILFVSLFWNITFEPFSECERIASNKPPKFIRNISLKGDAVEILGSPEYLYKAASEKDHRLAEIVVIISCHVIGGLRNRYLTASKYMECLYGMFGFIISIITGTAIPLILAIAIQVLLNLSNRKILDIFEDFLFKTNTPCPFKIS